MKNLRALWRNRRAAGATEYVLLLATICLAIVAGGSRLGTVLNSKLNSAGANVQNGS